MSSSEQNDFVRGLGQFGTDNRPNPRHRRKLRWQMLFAFNKSIRKAASTETAVQAVSRALVKSPVTRVTAAALVVVAAVACIKHLRPNDPASEIGSSPKLLPAPSAPNEPGMTVLKTKLPKPMFQGTEKDIRVEHLLKLSGKPRPPFLVPVGTENVALGKPVYSSDEEPVIGETTMITDGDKEAADGSYVELGPFLQHVTIDLQAEHQIYAVLLWHYHKQPTVYFDVVVQAADDPDFTANVRTLFSNDIDNSTGLGAGEDMHYIETYEGKLIDAKGIRARYVRLYSNGNNNNGLNHYIEVELYGRPVGVF